MPTETDLELLLWGSRAFALVALLGVLALFVGVWWVIVRPVLTEARRARSAGDSWLPFLPRPDGSHGPLAANRWWSALRATTRGSTSGLLVRWGFWTAVALGLTLGIGRALWDLGRLAGPPVS